jgi:photosystem II stability/assembly factor-like uncharacterized protein
MAVKIISQDPQIQANLSGVAFANCCDGVAVGANGAIITTNDGGNSWASQTSGFKGGFRDVAFADESRVVAVGDQCKIRISDDKGVTWAVPQTLRAFTGESDLLGGVGFKNAKVGYAVGVARNGGIPEALVLTTGDGGNTWSDQFVLTESADDVVDVDFSVMDGVTYVVAVGAGTTGIGGLVIRAEIGTTNWSMPAVLPSRTPNRLFGVSFAQGPHAQYGWAVGALGTILHTTDGGDTWTLQTSGISDEHLLRVAAIDDMRAWVVGINGSLLATRNGGENWIQQDIRGGGQLLDLSFCSPCLGTIVGVSATVLTVFGQA